MISAQIISRKITDKLVSLGFFLYPLNIQGVDPVDIVFVIAGFFLLGSLKSRFKTPGLIKISFILFIVSYFISVIVNPFKVSFVAGFFSNLCIVWVCINYFDSFYRIKSAVVSIVYGYLSLSLLAMVFSFFAYQPPYMFAIARDGRWMGMVGDPNFLALYSIPIFFLAIEQFGGSRLKLMPPLLAKVTALAAITEIVISQSRASWVALFIGLLVYVSVGGFKKLTRFIGYFGGALMIIAFLAKFNNSAFDFNSLGDRFESVSEHSGEAEEDRFAFVYTLTALALAPSHPLGVGPGMTANNTGMLSADMDPIGAHNNYVQILVENGWIAFIAHLIFISVAMRELHKCTISNHANLYLPPRPVLASFYALLVFGCFHDLIQWRFSWFIVLLTITVISKSRVRNPIPLARFKRLATSGF